MYALTLVVNFRPWWSRCVCMPGFDSHLDLCGLSGGVYDFCSHAIGPWWSLINSCIHVLQLW